MLEKLLLDFSDGQKMRKLEIRVVYSARKTLGLTGRGWCGCVHR